MQNIETAASQIKELIQHSRRMLILATSSNSDAIAATLGLAEAIKAFGRDVSIVNPTGLNSEVADLPGAQDIKKKLDPRSFVISIDYFPGSIEKVSYNTEGNKFNLIITPANGSNFTSNNVDYSSLGEEYDLLITTGVPDLGVLGEIYETNKLAWEGVPIINIDNNPANSQFGKVNALDHTAKTLSEVVTRVISSTRLPLNQKIGDLLMFGLRGGSNDFKEASPSTFEAAAQIARKLSGKQESTEEILVNEPFRKEQDKSEE